MNWVSARAEFYMLRCSSFLISLKNTGIVYEHFDHSSYVYMYEFQLVFEYFFRSSDRMRTSRVIGFSIDDLMISGRKL